MGLRKHRPLKPNKIRKVKERANGICEFEDCTEKIDDSNSERHHIKSVECGGTDDLNNLALICKKCHSKISQRDQLVGVRIEQYSEFLRKNPEMHFFRKKKILGAIEFYKKELEKEFRFKNRT